MKRVAKWLGHFSNELKAEQAPPTSWLNSETYSWLRSPLPIN
ncbi:hypothetical protein [Mycobacterium avium]|nr:hypothetical protein [Mycobacterium avium]